MNEEGLFFDWILTSGEGNDWVSDPLKKDVRGSLSELMLGECSTVEEALQYYKTYNEPVFRTSMIAIADTSGRTAFVSWEDGKISINEC